MSNRARRMPEGFERATYGTGRVPDALEVILLFESRSACDIGLVRKHERPADELARVGALLRNELVYPSSVPAGDIDVAVLIHVELVRTRQATRKAAPRASVIQKSRGR